MSEIMKVNDEREREKQQRQKRNKGVTEAIVIVWELNDFVARLS